MSPREQSPLSPPGSTIRVLLVEDNPPDVALIREFLKDASVPVTIHHVERLQDALSVLGENSFDIVLLDLSLPDTHGLETLRHLLDQPSNILPPVVVMTGLDDEDIATKAVQAGAQDYLVKSEYGATTLIRSLRYAIERSRLVRQLETTAKELAGSEELLRQATELAALGHWAWDAVEEKRIFGSEQQARIDDVPFEEYAKRVSTPDGYLSFVHPEDREEVKRLFDALRSGKGFEAEYRHITPRGETRFVRSIAEPVFDEIGTVILEYGTIQDITEQKRLELQRIHVEKMESLGVLASGIAHDFNNMLFAIIGLTESAANMLPDDSEAKTCLEGVLEAGESAADLVRQILVFGRQDEIRPRVIDLQDTLASILTLVRASLPATIEIHHSLDTACGPVMADPTHLHQILLNLASNAADAMQEKGGLLDVRLDLVNTDDRLMAHFPQLTPGPYARLTVRDTGCGIDDQILGRIFDPFFTTKDKDAGTGMGLAAVHGIISSYHGAIDVSSERGRGSTFDIYLPIWTGEGGKKIPRDDTSRPDGATRRRRPTSSGRTITVLNPA